MSAATVHARTGLPGGTSRYELIIRVNIHILLVLKFLVSPL